MTGSLPKSKTQSSRLSCLISLFSSFGVKTSLKSSYQGATENECPSQTYASCAPWVSWWLADLVQPTQERSDRERELARVPCLRYGPTQSENSQKAFHGERASSACGHQTQKPTACSCPGSPWNGLRCAGHLPVCETRATINISILCCCARMTEELACGRPSVS